MTIISHRTLRNDSAEILRRVAAGESFEITNHGEVVAVLMPSDASTPLERARQAGETVRPTRARSFGQICRVKGLSSVEVLDDLRDGR